MNTILIKEQPNKKTPELLEECKSLFPVRSYYNDERLDSDFPAPKEATERYFLDSVEPDEVTLGKLAREADPDMKGITLRERIIMEIDYFKKTGKHLDIKGLTLCSGSRYSDGDVPCAFWFGDGFKVRWYHLDCYDSGYGIRSAVALDSSSLLPLSLERAIGMVVMAGYKVSKE
jgi:hypothetical protein